MQLIYTFGVALMMVFSLAFGWYLTRFKMGIRGRLVKGISLMLLGTGIFVMTFVVTVFVVWPPFLPL
ncbi:hypothetical protein SY88_03085 [Clostridiales bacterium PH28_bin88]|nr:hypothetical protein SY88_03085 [Clostridiales bacterium PH28_bin88]